MLEMIKKQFQIRKNELIFLGVSEVAVFILGVILQVLIFNLDEDVHSVFELGTLIAFCFSLFVLMMFVLATFGVNFEYAVRMGRTRKSFLIAYIAVTLCHTFVAIITGFILSLIEKQLYTQLYSQYFYDNMVLAHITPLIVIVVIFVEVIIPMFVGALLLKYGMKAFWILWAIWMIGTVAIPKIFKSAIENENSVLGIFERKLAASLGGINIAFWIIIGGVILIIMLISTFNMILNQRANV